MFLAYKMIFSRSQHSDHLIGFFTPTCMKALLEGKDFGALDMLFPFTSAVVDRVSGSIGSTELRRVHTTI